MQEFKDNHGVDKVRCTNHCLKISVDPGPFDVICGRGRGIAKHSGNRRFHVIISLHRERYQRATKGQKSMISKEVIDAIHRGGARFLTKYPGTDTYVEAGEECTRKKVAHAFRDGYTQTKKKQSKTKSNSYDAGYQADDSLNSSDSEGEKSSQNRQISIDSNSSRLQMRHNQKEFSIFEEQVPIEYVKRTGSGIIEEGEKGGHIEYVKPTGSGVIEEGKKGGLDSMNFEEYEKLHKRQQEIFNDLIAGDIIGV